MIEIFDENMKPLGVMSRTEAHKSGQWHRTFHCWIVSSLDGRKILFQKRGKDKKLFPNYLDITAAGHYVAGETAQDGIREILEELGIKVTFKELVPLGIKFDIAKVGEIINREFCDVFLLRRDANPREYKPKAPEVQGLVEIAIQDGLALFSRRKDKVRASGIELGPDTEEWKEIEIEVGIGDIIPRIDPYYYKVFIMAERFLDGEEHLSI